MLSAVLPRVVVSVIDESDELETIHAAIAGDEQAFDQLVGVASQIPVRRVSTTS